MATTAMLGEALDRVGKILHDLEPDLLEAAEAQGLIGEFSRGEKLCASGRTLLARVVRDPKAMAKAAGISEGEAAQNVKASDTAAEQPGLDEALRHGGLSADQVHAVAKGAKADPSRLDELLDMARKKSLNELRERARDLDLRAKDPDDLYAAQRAARMHRSWIDALGMACGSYRLTPEVGAAVRGVIEAEAKRLHRAARRAGSEDTFPHALADAFASLVTTGGGTRTPRAEVVLDVSLDALLRGVVWDGDEVCEVRGVGPIPVWKAREIMDNAFLKALLTEGTEVKLVKHFGRHVSAEVKTALEWRHRVCPDCGSRFHLEWDHVNPLANGGETSYSNLKARCWECHVVQTEDDRTRGFLGKDPPRRRE